MYGFKNVLKKTIVTLMIVLSFTFVLPIIGNVYQAQAKVDKKGKILAVNKGTCKVIATAGGKNYTCNVTVTDYNDCLLYTSE